MDNASSTPATAAVTPSVHEVLSKFLQDNKVLKLATTGGPVSPWITGTYFVEDGVRALHLILEPGGKGMTNIKAHAKVALAIDANDPFATFVQAEATASVISGTEAGERLEQLKRKVPEIAPLLMGPHVVIRLEIKRWLVTSFGNGWFPARELIP